MAGQTDVIVTPVPGPATLIVELTGGLPAAAPTDHGALTGLTDDDHLQYHTDARGDARYSLQGHTHDVSYDPLGAAAALVNSHAVASDPHPQYQTQAENDSRYAGTLHSHAVGDVTGLQTTLDGKAATSHSHGWAEITGKPATFPPADHQHDASYDPLGAATAAVATHAAAADPHPGYTTPIEAAAAAPVQSVAGRVGAVTLTAGDISGLGSAATRNIGTTAGTVAAGDHGHAGAYEPLGTVAAHAVATDPHTQYHDDPRGDARYLKLTGGSLSGPLSVSGDIEIGYLANYKKNGSDVIAPLQTGIQQLQTVAGRLVSPIIRDLGAYIDQSLTGSAHTTLAGVAGRIDLTPVCFPKNTPVDRLGVNVVGAASGALGRVVIYSSDVLNGTPTNRVFYGAADLLLGTAGVKEHTASFTFTAGVQYWVGFHHSSIANLSAIPAVALPSLGLSASNATNVYTAIRQTVAYASGAPMTFGFDAATHLTANVPATSVRLRIGPTAMG